MWIADQVTSAHTLKVVCRPLVIAVLVLSLTWQLLASAWPGGAAVALEGGEHAALHWADEAHHHHEDGSAHGDDSEESACHMALDNGSVAALVMAVGCDTLAPHGVVRTEHCARAGPHPFLDGPLRPPRLTA